MKRQLPNTIYGLKFTMEKNEFERLKSSTLRGGLYSQRASSVAATPNIHLISSSEKT